MINVALDSTKPTTNGIEDLPEDSIGIVSGNSSLIQRTRSSASDGGKTASASGHSVSSLTLALEHEVTRKSFVSNVSNDSNGLENDYSSDEENFAAAIAEAEAEDKDRVDSQSSSLKDFMATNSGSDTPTTNNMTGSYNSNSNSNVAGMSKLFIQQPVESSNLTINSANQNQNQAQAQDSPIYNTNSHSNGNGTIEQEKAWQFQAKDLLNVLVDYLDSLDKNILPGGSSLTAETLSLASNNAPKRPPMLQTLLTDPSHNPDTNSNSNASNAKPASTTRSSTSHISELTNIEHTPERLNLYKLLPAEDDGEIMDDLPEFGLNADVLGMGIDHFCLIRKGKMSSSSSSSSAVDEEENNKVVLHVKVEEKLVSRENKSRSRIPTPRPLSAGVSTPPIIISISGTTTPTNQDNQTSSYGNGNGNDSGKSNSNSNSTNGNGKGSLNSPTRGSRAFSEGEFSYGNSGSGSGSGDGNVNGSGNEKSRKRLIVSVKLPNKSIWTEIKRIRVYNSTSSSDGGSAAGGAGIGNDYSDSSAYFNTQDFNPDSTATNAALNATLTKGAFSGTTNAAEISALRALMCGTVGEIHSLDIDATATFSGDPTLVLPSLSNQISSGRGHSENATKGAFSPGDSSTGSTNITWRRVTSYGSGSGDGDGSQSIDIDDDSVSITPSENTFCQSDNDNDMGTLGMSKEGAESYLDGGYNDDLAGDGDGDDALDMSLEGMNLNVNGNNNNNNDSTASASVAVDTADINSKTAPVLEEAERPRSIFGRMFGSSSGRPRRLSNPNAPEGALFDLEIE
jgi:hypothetical protein